MQRVVIYLKRRADLLQPVFFDWWLGQQDTGRAAPWAASVHHLARRRRAGGALDGMAELWFDDLAAGAAFASQQARQHAPTPTPRRSTRAPEPDGAYDYRPSRATRFKYTAGLKRRADMSREAFAQWWLERHVPYVKPFPNVRKYRVSLIESGPRQSPTVSPKSGLTTWPRCGAPPARWSRRRSGTRRPYERPHPPRRGGASHPLTSTRFLPS